MGGIVAMEMVHQAPDRVDRLALLSTNPKAELPDVAAGRAVQIKVARAGHLGEMMQRDLFPRYLAPTPPRPDLLDLALDMALGLGAEVFERQSLALANRADQQGTLAAYHGPTLLLAGDQDRLCPADRHDLMQSLMPHAHAVRISGAGHLPTLEKPHQTTQEMLDWLGRAA